MLLAIGKDYTCTPEIMQIAISLKKGDEKSAVSYCTMGRLRLSEAVATPLCDTCRDRKKTYTLFHPCRRSASIPAGRAGHNSNPAMKAESGVSKNPRF